MTDEELDRINRAEEIQLYTENRCEALEKENHLVKSLLYCTKGTCDNCGFVNCENFQMQRKSEPCALYISYKDRIKKLEEENNELKAFRQDCVKLTEDNVVMARQRAETAKKLTKAKDLLNEFMRISKASDEDFEHDYSELIAEAEKFLKEE